MLQRWYMRKKRKSPVINSGSTADIAFLLLIFFMVVTTFKREKMMSMKLPPPYDGPVGQIPEKRVVEFLINANNEVMLEKDLFDESNKTLPAYLDDILSTKGKPIINIKMHPDSKYQTYTKVLSEIKLGIKSIRQDYAQTMFKKDLETLNQIEYDKIKRLVAIRITESQIE